MQQLTVVQSPTVPSAPEIVASGAGELFQGPRQRVLILEDDPAFRESLASFLSEAGFSIVAAQSGVDGLQVALGTDFDIILCDMMMPVLPGNLFFRTIERMRPQLRERFIFMTGHRDNPKISEFIQVVGRPALAKPFHCDDLLEMIAYVQIQTAIWAAA